MKKMSTIIRGRLLAGAGNTHPLTLSAINHGYKPIPTDKAPLVPIDTTLHGVTATRVGEKLAAGVKHGD